MPDAVQRRRRDPEARRRAIISAAAELIVESGSEALTHRKVAARAGVPLGATTQYFETLDDLRTAALRALADEVDARLDGIRSTLAERGATAAVLTDLLTRLADAHAIEADRAVVTAAVHDPQLRALARASSARFAGFLAPEYGQERATAAAIFIDGILWHSHLSNEPLSRRLIETALAGILGDDTHQPPAND